MLLISSFNFTLEHIKNVLFLENQIKETVNNTFGAVNLRISHSTRKPLNGIVKDLTPDPENAT